MSMNLAILQITEAGFGASLQDTGRVGWRRFGVPSSGAMDDHAAAWANRLLENPAEAPVLELLLQGVRLTVLQDIWLAVTGADAQTNVPTWRAVHARNGDVLQFPRNRSGTWSYVAVEGGFAGETILGSASVYPRGSLGTALKRGDILSRAAGKRFQLPSGVASRMTPALERRDYNSPPVLRVWPGPQAALFSDTDHARLFSQAWQVTSQSDRVGYRLTGTPLESRLPQIISEPVRVGTIQVPENGLPIVTMRDGPTVGGYPKLGLIEPGDLSWLAQCRPGQTVRFRPADETRS